VIPADFIAAWNARLQASPMRPMTEDEARDVRALFGTIEPLPQAA
jgi:hypothetical protein